ncbi:hypothetical protein FAM09_00135 [Niastella caeni]|uniref:Uncharacterized protein n=1 Tax=Niastella caeni TaxID=2569763 RepID=A0A4S8HXR1_9BACT|nr:hypothetical protein [Niastella caeni]THU40558.1 hypothetical protein FAM09_00135 [Niastella caeni]
MGDFFSELLDWSEAWAPLVALGVWVRHRKQPAYLKPVVFYIWFALVCNVLIDCIWKLRMLIHQPYNSNNWLYNLHSIVRMLAFSRFFILLHQPFLQTVKRAVPVLFLLLVVIDFSIYEHLFDYNTLSSQLMALEAGLLLFYCLQYYFYKVKEDLDMNRRQPDFWVVTGLGIYVAINFFIFLLYKELTVHYTHFAVDIWSIHNVSYILFQLFLAKALYESSR